MVTKSIQINTVQKTENVRKGKSPTVTEHQGCVSPVREHRIDGNNGISNWTMLRIVDVLCFFS